MNKIERKLLENQALIMFALGVMAIKIKHFGLDTRLKYEIEKIRKLLEEKNE